MTTLRGDYARQKDQIKDESGGEGFWNLLNPRLVSLKDSPPEAAARKVHFFANSLTSEFSPLEKKFASQKSVAVAAGLFERLSSRR